MTRKSFFVLVFALSLVMISSSGFAQAGGGGLVAHISALTSDNAHDPATRANPTVADVAPEELAAPEASVAVTPVRMEEPAQPQDGSVGILFLLSRSARVRVALTDDGGKELCPALEDQYARGLHRATVSTKHLGAGSYQLLVTSEGLTRVRPFIVR